MQGSVTLSDSPSPIQTSTKEMYFVGTGGAFPGLVQKLPGRDLPPFSPAGGPGLVASCPLRCPYHQRKWA